MPNSISVLQLGTNHRLVKSDIGIIVKVVKGSDNDLIIVTPHKIKFSQIVESKSADRKLSYL